MARRRRGIPRRLPGLRKKARAPKSTKQRTAAKWAKYKKRRRPPLNTVPPAGEPFLPEVNYHRLRIDQIRISHEQANVDENLVSSIAESYVISGQIEPIVVEIGMGAYPLVAGAHRLAAAKAAGLEYIDCRFFDGDEKEARLLQIAENLFRKNITILEQAELWTEWAAQVLESKLLFYGQVVVKRGRPEGILSKLARQMPVYGSRSFEARKKKLERAHKIAALPSDVKQAAKDAGLDNNQRALLAIADAGSPEAQHRKIRKLRSRHRVQQAKKKLTEDETITGTTEDEENTHQPAADADASGQADQDEDETEVEDLADTTLAQLRDHWASGNGNKMWAYTPRTVRKEFIEYLNSKPCKSNSDVEPLVKDLFAGRQEIRQPVLHAYTDSKGLHWNQVTKCLRRLGYRRRKTGPQPGAALAYVNPDSEFRRIVSGVSNDELEAPYLALQDAILAADKGKTEINMKDENTYYDD